MWTHDPWHDKYFRPDPKYYYEPQTEAERMAYIKKWDNFKPTTGEEWCLKNNYEVWKRNRNMKDYPPEYDIDQDDNKYFAEAFPDADSPAELYRQVYKYTDCGAYLSVQIQYFKTIEPDGFNEFPFDKLVSEWVHCGALGRLGTWKDLDQQGVLVTAILVGSIVEGVDEGTDNIEIEAKQLDETPSEYRSRFYAALKEVEEQAESIWQDTHGCESCQAYWTDQGIDLDDSGGLVPVYKYCPDCQGHGTSI